MRPRQLFHRRRQLDLTQPLMAELLQTSMRNYIRWEVGDTPVPKWVDDFFDAWDWGWMPRRLREPAPARRIENGRDAR